MSRKVVHNRLKVETARANHFCGLPSRDRIGMRVTRRTLLKGAGQTLAAPLWTRLLHAATVNRAPYIQSVTQNSTTVMWTTEEAGEHALTVSRSPALENGRILRAETREFLPAETGMPRRFLQHRVDIAGLEPDTDYFYVARLGNDSLTPGRAVPFRTAPRSGTAFRFLVYGDSGLGSPEQNTIAALMKADESVSLVLHTGDVVYPAGSFDGFDSLYFRIYRSLMESVPFYPCLGNHDTALDDGRAYLAGQVFPNSGVPAPWTGRYYSFDWGDVHFVCLDSNLMMDEAAARAMVRWLDRDLSSTRQGWRVVYFHHTPYDPMRGNDPPEAALRAQVLPLLDKYGVQLVFAGHHHAYTRTVSVAGGQHVEDGRGTVDVTTGGGGAGLYSEVTHPLVTAGASLYHYVRVEVRGNQMAVTAIDKDGRQFDHFTLSPQPVTTTSSVVDGATFRPELARGGIVSIFGQNLAFQHAAYRSAPLPQELAQVKVSLNSRLLPLYFVSPGQINAHLPYDCPGAGTIKVELGPGRETQASVRVSDAAPGIFVDESGTPAIVKAGGKVVSAQDPALPGEYLSIYAAGLGRVDGSIQAGEATPRSPLLATVQPVTVRLGPSRLTPQFAGLAPDFIGVYQVNFQVPQNLSAGMYDLTLLSGLSLSNTVKLAVG